MSPSIPLVWVSRCATVTCPARSAAPSRRPGSASAKVVSRDSSPSSISCMIMVAVHSLVIDPTWNTESVLTRTPVARLRTPCAASISCPSAQMPSTAPGTRACRASSPRRVVQFAASSMVSTLADLSGPVLWPFGQGFVTWRRGSVIIACRRLWWTDDGSPGRRSVGSLAGRYYCTLRRFYEHHGHPGHPDRGPAPADLWRRIRGRPADAGTVRGGAPDLRTKPRGPRADHRHRHERSPRRAGRDRGADRAGHGRPGPAAARLG